MPSQQAPLAELFTTAEMWSQIEGPAGESRSNGATEADVVNTGGVLNKSTQHHTEENDEDLAPVEAPRESDRGPLPTPNSQQWQEDCQSLPTGAASSAALATITTSLAGIAVDSTRPAWATRSTPTRPLRSWRMLEQGARGCVSGDCDQIQEEISPPGSSIIDFERSYWRQPSMIQDLPVVFLYTAQQCEASAPDKKEPNPSGLTDQGPIQRAPNVLHTPQEPSLRRLVETGRISAVPQALLPEVPRVGAIEMWQRHHEAVLTANLNLLRTMALADHDSLRARAVCAKSQAEYMYLLPQLFMVEHRYKDIVKHLREAKADPGYLIIHRPVIQRLCHDTRRFHEEGRCAIEGHNLGLHLAGTR
ncbi:uncharacterized protein DSM5745_00755 [Aspergillus mulundensis]|uniref:Uncharacterized protein n=1 Tax=Aspergillus mulundensis TaxID=1810919 RepID=A0A3D8T4F4_9EURO|nr:hypothetical protein DSM5745_00755 [Aspergillus mulundensis]RDW93433.1 hypothetical protein DSM5745_00755 [Aspergillus mulundensis]